jgi:predicted AlkP superfamily pyrophosphatase or phosphodiesterase
MTHSRWFAVVLAVAGSAALLACMQATAGAAGQPLVPAPRRPTLVVLITVDQFRGDLLDRFHAQEHGGLARLTRGAWFDNAFQDHAITETAPGHASTLSGRFPRSTGIASNSIGVADPNSPLLGGLPHEAGASPRRFQGTTLVDWLTSKDSRTRAVSVSRKDRGAILPIGTSKQNVYWYSAAGLFTTSTYYRDSLPDWVRAFNARGIPQSYAGAAWKLSRESTAYAEADSVPYEHGGQDFTFPHQFPADTLAAVSYLMATPMMDSLTALFALEALRQTDIGRGPQTDVFAVSFSATDYVGHAYGPDSREAHENQLRLDETIGWFLDSLFAVRDSATVMIALTGDHGMSPIPELARRTGLATGNEGLRVSLAGTIAAVRAGLRAAGADTTALVTDGQLVAVDRDALQVAHLNADSLLDAFARAARQVSGVARVDRMRDVRRADFTADPIARRWAHQIPESMPIEEVVTLTRYSIYASSIPATHGSPWDQDAWVPVVFYGPWARPGRYHGFTRVVDLGVTLAAIAGVSPTEKVDGVVLTEGLRP